MTDKPYFERASINGAVHEIPCSPSEAPRVRELAQRLDDRVRGLASALGAGPDAQLLLLAAITLEDEREAAMTEVRFLRSELERVRDQLTADPKAAHRDQLLAQRLLSAAERIASITEKLDAA